MRRRSAPPRNSSTNGAQAGHEQHDLKPSPAQTAGASTAGQRLEGGAQEGLRFQSGEAQQVVEQADRRRL